VREQRAAALLAGVSEKKWQDTVIAICRARGYLVYHTHDSRRSAPGFPDLVIAGHGRVIFAELKVVGADLDPAQRAWANQLAEAVKSRNQGMYLWRPGDLDEINEVLG
jgi:hypothetical protein